MVVGEAAHAQQQVDQGVAVHRGRTAVAVQERGRARLVDQGLGGAVGQRGGPPREVAQQFAGHAAQAEADHGAEGGIFHDLDAAGHAGRDHRLDQHIGAEGDGQFRVRRPDVVLVGQGQADGAQVYAVAERTAGWFPDDVRAVAGFHGGGLVTEEPDSPHRSIADSRAAYVLLHADHDGSLTPQHVAVLEEALTAAGRPHVNEIVPCAPHGYTMSDTSMWDEAGEKRHFAELRALLDGALR